MIIVSKNGVTYQIAELEDSIADDIWIGHYGDDRDGEGIEIPASEFFDLIDRFYKKKI